MTEISGTKAVSGGTVSGDEGAVVTRRGVCWSQSENPTVSDASTSDGEGLGSFRSELTGLQEGAVYHVRAYAVSGNETIYGNAVSFKAESLVPTVTTSVIDDISYRSATGGGTVESPGASEVTAVGICWSTEENPTIENDNTEGDPSETEFSLPLENLRSGTLYYVRAFAANESGVAYGQQVSFTTLAEELVVLPDPAFMQYALDNFDENWDGQLQTGEIAAVTSIDCSGLGTQGIDSARVKVSMLSDGTGTYNNFYNYFGDAATAEQNWESYASEVEALDWNHGGRYPETRSLPEFESYTWPYYLSTRPDYRLVVQDGSLLESSCPFITEKLGEMEIESIQPYEMLSALPESSRKRFYDMAGFDYDKFAALFDASPKKNLIIIGTSHADDASARLQRDYVARIMEQYGAQYDVFFKPHPADTTSAGYETEFPATLDGLPDGTVDKVRSSSPPMPRALVAAQHPAPRCDGCRSGCNRCLQVVLCRASANEAWPGFQRVYRDAASDDGVTPSEFFAQPRARSTCSTDVAHGSPSPPRNSET